MSANIYWVPKKPGRDLPVGAPSSFIKTLESAFGSLPIRLTHQDWECLRGMKAASGDNFSEAYDDLLEAIQKYGEIEVWAEY